jgi:hypothetical protein
MEFIKRLLSKLGKSGLADKIKQIPASAQASSKVLGRNAAKFGKNHKEALLGTAGAAGGGALGAMSTSKDEEEDEGSEMEEMFKKAKKKSRDWME